MFKRFQKERPIPQREVVVQPVAPDLFDVAIDDSMWEEETRYQEKPKKRVYKRKSRIRGKEAVKKSIVDYLAGRKVKTSTKQIAKAVGVSAGYPPRLIRELVASKTIRVEGKGYKRRYHVIRNGSSTSAKPKGAGWKSKGEVYSPNYQRTFEYISAHEGRKISLQEIAGQVGVTDGQVHRYIQRLLDTGSIVRRPIAEGKPNLGFVYWLQGTVEAPQAQPAKMVESKNEPQFVAVLEGLMWEYLKETNRFDDGASIHTFIEWLKTKGE